MSEIATTVVGGIQVLLRWWNIHPSSAEVQASHEMNHRLSEVGLEGALEPGSRPCAGLEGLGFLRSPGCAAPIQHIPANRKKSGPKHQPAGFVEEEEARGFGFSKAQSNESVLPVCREAAADSLLELPWGGTSAYKAD